MVSLEGAKNAVRSALLDDFDTPTAIVRLADLIRDCNKYMEGTATPISSSTGRFYAFCCFIIRYYTIL
jgi:cysteinyl-tRNA synthetase